MGQSLRSDCKLMRVLELLDLATRAAVLLTIVSACLATVCGAEGAAISARQPNVLLIYTDDHAQWAVGAYGNKVVHTPNIDRLAAEGMRFRQAFTKPVCSPSRAMVLTGKYSHRLGIPDYIPYGNPVHVDNGLPAGTPTIASLLNSAGYRTGQVAPRLRREVLSRAIRLRRRRRFPLYRTGQAIRSRWTNSLPDRRR